MKIKRNLKVAVDVFGKRCLICIEVIELQPKR